ncbi:hypothetical protein HMPREF3145_04720 [Corynebacterium sp. HMSC05C01]|nr:hypothetical protein HMPREF3145_04720 [Corynebacterium sp. HMSC05C01]
MIAKLFQEIYEFLKYLLLGQIWDVLHRDNLGAQIHNVVRKMFQKIHFGTFSRCVNRKSVVSGKRLAGSAAHEYSDVSVAWIKGAKLSGCDLRHIFKVECRTWIIRLICKLTVAINVVTRHNLDPG